MNTHCELCTNSLCFLGSFQPNRLVISPYKISREFICSNMCGPRDYHAKGSKSDRERQILYDITCGIKKINNTNELILKTEIDPQTWKTHLW